MIGNVWFQTQNIVTYCDTNKIMILQKAVWLPCVNQHVNHARSMVYNLGTGTLQRGYTDFDFIEIVEGMCHHEILKHVCVKAPLCKDFSV